MKIFKLVRRFLITWNELITLPFAFILFYFSPTILRWWDPTAATYDYGIFQIMLFTLIQFLFYHGIVWIMIKVTWPGVDRFLDQEFEEVLTSNLNSLSFYEKAKLALGIFALYFLVIVLLSRVL